MDLPFRFPLPTVALVGANSGFLIGSKDEDEEVGAGLQIVAGLQIGAESFIRSRLLPSSLEVYLTCLFRLVGGGEGEGDGDGDGDGAGAGSRLRRFEADGPLLHPTFIVPHLTHTHPDFNCFSH